MFEDTFVQRVTSAQRNFCTRIWDYYYKIKQKFKKEGFRTSVKTRGNVDFLKIHKLKKNKYSISY